MKSKPFNDMEARRTSVITSFISKWIKNKHLPIITRTKSYKYT